MPKNIVGRRALCLEVMKQELPHNSNDKDGVPNIRPRNEAKHVVIKALMEMGQGFPMDDTMEKDDKGEEDDKRENDKWEMAI